MRKRVPIVLAVLLAAIGGLAVWAGLHARQKEPVVDGRPLMCWLDQNDGSLEAERKARRAVEKAGTNAVPALLGMLRQRDSLLKRRVMELAQSQRFIKVHYIPAESRNCEAWVAFTTLGARAEGAVPALMEIYDMNVSWWSQMYVVKSLGAIGPVAKMATSVLLRAATNRHFLVRGESLDAFVRIHAEPEVAVPALTRALNDPNYTVRFVACNSLSQFGDGAKQAVPALVPLLHDPNDQVRGAASRALLRVDPEAAAKAGVK